MSELTKEELIKLIKEEDEINSALIKKILLGNLFKFNKFALGVGEDGKNVPLAPFHQEMCKFIDKNPKRFKLVLVPRGHLKSTLVTVGKSLQWMYQDPSVRILIANATYRMATTFVGQIQRNLKFNAHLIERFGSIADNPVNWTNDTITLEAAKEAHGKKEATLTGFGMGGNLVSQHYDKIILDDVVNRDSVNTRDQIEKTILFFKDILDLLEPGGELIILGTRWHDEDLYGWIMDKENDVISSFDIFMRPAFTGNLRDHLNFHAIWPEKFTRNVLEKLYREKGPYEFCTPSETPILMSDFTTKKISEIKAGDEVIGFSRENEERSKLIKTKVKKVSQITDLVYSFKMQSGRKVRCTKKHRWYTARFSKNRKLYTSAKVGTELLYVCPVNNYELTEKEKLAWFYLAGIFDGEGSAKSGGCLSITQADIYNKDVYDKIIDTLKFLGLEYSEYYRSPYTNYRGRNSTGGKMIWLKNNFETSLKFIRITNLAKKQQIVDKLVKKGKRFIRERDRILDIKEDGIEPVYALETETGNYIAWGYASSNSAQYLNEVIPDTDATFRKEWFHYYDETELRGRPLNKFTAVDPAISLDKEADYTAMVTIGIDSFHNWYILDVFRDRVTPSELIEQLYRTYERWHPIEIAIENVAFQKVLQYSINEEGRKRKKYLPVVEVKPEERSKDERIRGLQPLYANGVILHNKDLVYNDYLEDELTRFPRGKHDDIIDAMSYLKDIVSAPRRATRDYEGQSKTHKYLY
jgi:predicted phage terminase large subunit-like protein